MGRIVTEHQENAVRHFLGKRELINGAEILVRLRGNAGWEHVVVEGLPQSIRIRFMAADGHPIVTTLPYNADLRWPDEAENKREALERPVP